ASSRILRRFRPSQLAACGNRSGPRMNNANTSSTRISDHPTLSNTPREYNLRVIAPSLVACQFDVDGQFTILAHQRDGNHLPHIVGADGDREFRGVPHLAVSHLLHDVALPDPRLVCGTAAADSPGPCASAAV